MSVTEIMTLMSAAAAAIVAIINAIKAPQTRAKVEATHTQVGELGKSINGRLSEMLHITRQVAFQEGFQAGRGCDKCPVHSACDLLPALSASGAPTPPAS